MKRPDLECAFRMAYAEYDEAFHHTIIVKGMVTDKVEHWQSLNLIDTDEKTEEKSCDSCVETGETCPYGKVLTISCDYHKPKK